MSRLRWRFVLRAAVLVSLPATSAWAQVGYPPDRSPYTDISTKGEVGIFGGYYLGNKGSAGVGPQSAPAIGGRYEIHLGGPMFAGVRLVRTSSNRTVIDPTLAAADRVIGTKSAPLYMLDANLILALTGQKTYHRFIPVISGGLGLASDFAATDAGGYKLGTTFGLNFGAGIRWVASRRTELRFDAIDNIFQLSYPNSYLATPAGGGNPVLDVSQGQNEWKHTLLLTLGVSYLFRR